MKLSEKLREHIVDNYESIAAFSQESGIPLSSIKKYIANNNAKIPSAANKNKLIALIDESERDAWMDLMIQETLSSRGVIEADDPFLEYHVARQVPFKEILKHCNANGQTRFGQSIKSAIEQWNISTKAFAALFDVAGSSVEKILGNESKLERGATTKKRLITRALMEKFTENESLVKKGIAKFDSKTRNLAWAMANGDSSQPDIETAIEQMKQDYTRYSSVKQLQKSGLEKYKQVMKHYNFGDAWVAEKTGNIVKEEMVNHYRNNLGIVDI